MFVSSHLKGKTCRYNLVHNNNTEHTTIYVLFLTFTKWHPAQNCRKYKVMKNEISQIAENSANFLKNSVSQKVEKRIDYIDK